MSCWCGGDFSGYGKHLQRKLKTEPCPESRAANTAHHRTWLERPGNRERVNAYNREHVTGWRPGTELALDDDVMA